VTEQGNIDERQEPTQEDTELLQTIVQDVRSNPDAYREAGKWLDDYCSDDAYWQRLERKVEELKLGSAVRGYGPLADVHALEHQLKRKDQTYLYMLLADAYRFLTDKCKGQASVSQADARRILLVAWLSVDDETESLGVFITRLQTCARDSEADVAVSRLDSAKNWIIPYDEYWTKLVRLAWEQVQGVSASKVDNRSVPKADNETKPIWAGMFSLHGFPINLKNLWAWVGKFEGWKKPVVAGIVLLLLTCKWWIPMLNPASRQATSSTSLSGVDEGLKRITFTQDCSKPLMSMSVIVTLKRECTPEDLGHFRFLVGILNLHESAPHPELWIAGRDAYSTRPINGTSEIRMGVKSLAWSQAPDQQIQNTTFATNAPTTRQLEAGGHLYKRGPYKTLGDLDKRCIQIYLTRPLLNVTAGIYVLANGYLIAGNSADRFVPLDLAPAIAWPDPLSDAEARIPWVGIALKIEHPPDWMPAELARTGWSLDFSTVTPEKQRTTIDYSWDGLRDLTYFYNGFGDKKAISDREKQGVRNR
jgi:hypothetical protein